MHEDIISRLRTITVDNKASYIYKTMTEAADYIEQLEADRRQLSDAIYNEGSHPEYHRKIMDKHSREWPVLWKAISKLLEVKAW